MIEDAFQQDQKEQAKEFLVEWGLALYLNHL